MKTLNFNKKSWHHWLATTVANYDDDEGDFCSYVRSVLWGAFVVLLLSSIVGAILFAVGLEIRAAYTCWFTPVCTYGKNEQAIATGAAILAAVAALGALCFWNENRKIRIRIEINNGTRQPRQPGFIALAYEAIKEKTCFRVEFK
jgi:hypothetical protein